MSCSMLNTCSCGNIAYFKSVSEEKYTACFNCRGKEHTVKHERVYKVCEKFVIRIGRKKIICSNCLIKRKTVSRRPRDRKLNASTEDHSKNVTPELMLNYSLGIEEKITPPGVDALLKHPGIVFADFSEFRD